MNTYSKIKLSRGKADIKKLTTQCPFFDFDQKYNFTIEPFSKDETPKMDGSNQSCVSFSSTYDNKEEYLSRFFLDPDDAITLGSHLIRTGLRCKAYNNPLFVRSDYLDKLLLDIGMGYVDTLIVKYHKKYIPEINYDLNYNNRFWHLYNIYPIYKYGIKNNHFNFNIPLNITDYTSYTGETSNLSLKDKINRLFGIDNVYNIDNMEDLSEEEKEIIKNANNKYPGLIHSTNNKIKIKLVNFRKIAKEDMDESIKYNIDAKKKFEEKKEKMLNESVNAVKEREQINSNIRDLIQSTPVAADGSIDFNKIMEKLVINNDQSNNKVIDINKRKNK